MIGTEGDLTPESIIAAAMADPSPAEAARTALTVAQPIAKPHMSQIAAALPVPAPPALRVPERPIIMASLERPSSKPASATPVIRRASANGKGGRVVGDEAVVSAARRAPQPVSAETIARRIEIASLITNPERRAVETKMERPVADTLIGNLPSAIFSRGFSSKGSVPSGAQHFEGTAVNFLPVHKLD